MSAFVDRIVKDVADHFGGFGGGRVVDGNPISAALKDRLPMFAACVDVRQVVEHVIKSLREPSEAMLSAGDDAIEAAQSHSQVDDVTVTSVSHDAHLMVWRAMLDKA